MNQVITIDGLVNQIIAKSGEKSQLQSRIQELNEIICQSKESQELQELKESLQDVERQEEGLREVAKQEMLVRDLKSITLLSGMTVQLNATPGSLKIEDESKIPAEYIKTKEVTSIDKVKIKADIKEGCIIEGCSIETDYKFIIKA